MRRPRWGKSVTFFGTRGASTGSRQGSDGETPEQAAQSAQAARKAVKAVQQARPGAAGQNGPDVRGVVVCGSDRTMLRVVTELVDSGENVTALVNPDSRHFERISLLGARVIKARVIHKSLLVAAGLNRTEDRQSTARALVLLDTDDVHNVHTALTAREMDPSIKIVVQMVNPRLGKQLPDLIGDCEVISGPSLAAPAFVADALADDELTWVELGGRQLVAGPAELIREPHLTVLADIKNPAQPNLLPADRKDPANDIVLGTGIRTVWRTKDVRRAGWLVATRDIFDRRVRMIVAVMGILVVAGTALTHYIAHVEWLRALYLAMGAVTSAGIEDDTFANAKPWAKVAAVVVQLTGIMLMALLTAVIVDSLIGARLSRVIGGVRGRPSNHLVVCGLGTVGARVLEILSERGVAVVGVEHDEDAPGVQTAHRLRIPVIIGDSSNEETLRSAGVERAQAVLAITNGDITNLESAMVVRDLNKEARITMRMFDHDLAQRVQEQLKLGNSRSVSMLVAPAIAAAVANRLTQTTVPAGRRVLLLTEVVVERDSTAVGRRLGELEESGGMRVLARHDKGVWDWTPARGRQLKAGDRITVAATRSGLARLLLTTRAPRRSGRSGRIEA